MDRHKGVFQEFGKRRTRPQEDALRKVSNPCPGIWAPSSNVDPGRPSGSSIATGNSSATSSSIRAAIISRRDSDDSFHYAPRHPSTMPRDITQRGGRGTRTHKSFRTTVFKAADLLPALFQALSHDPSPPGRWSDPSSLIPSRTPRFEKREWQQNGKEGTANGIIFATVVAFLLPTLILLLDGLHTAGGSAHSRRPGTDPRGLGPCRCSPQPSDLGATFRDQPGSSITRSSRPRRARSRSADRGAAIGPVRASGSKLRRSTGTRALGCPRSFASSASDNSRETPAGPSKRRSVWICRNRTSASHERH